MPAGREAVTAAEIIRNFGYWQQKALNQPITITHHGRARVLLISTDEYDRLHEATPTGGTKVDEETVAQRVKADALIDNMAEGFLLMDPEFRILEMNRVAEAYYGIERSTSIGRKLLDIFPDAGHSLMLDRIRQVQRTGEIAAIDTASATYPDRRISARIFPVRENIAVLFLNTTEMEHLRDEGSQWRACCDAMNQHSGVSLVRLDGRGRVISADDKFDNFTGFTASDLNHVKIFDIVTPNSRKRFQNAFEDLFVNRLAVQLKVSILVKQGGERTFQVALAPLTKDFIANAALMVMIPESVGAPEE